MSLPTQEYLQSRIDYNPETGEARWKLVDESYGKNWKMFNARYAGRVLGQVARIEDEKYSTTKLLYVLHNGTEPKSKVRFRNSNNEDYSAANLVDSADIAIKVGRAAIIDPDYKLAKLLPLETTKLLRLDHVTGELYWNLREDKSFNTRYYNKQAGNYTDRYARVYIFNSAYKIHRVAWLLYYGVDPVGYQIDHIDKNKHNNSVLNLRLASNSLNASFGTGRYYKKGNRYGSELNIHGKTITIGTYDTPLEAEQAAQLAIEKYKPSYKFTESEQALLDQLYNTYPNCSPDLQRSCHELQIKAVKYFDDAAIVQTPNLEYNSSS